MAIRGAVCVALLGPFILPLASSQSPLPPLDCAWGDVPFRAGPAWNHMTWGYETTQWEPAWLPGEVLWPLLDRTSAFAWSWVVNNCGLLDESDINFHVGPGIAPGTGPRNGHTEIFWAPNQGQAATAVVTENDCDIVLGPEAFPDGFSSGRLAALVSRITTEMGRCGGLGTAQDSHQTMGGGLCVPTLGVLVHPALWSCGLTLGRGDILAMNSRYPV